MEPEPDQPGLDFTQGNEDGLALWRSSVRPPANAEQAQPMELSFSASGDQVNAWRQEQMERSTAIARREGLPIGEMVRVLLQSDLELTGRLAVDLENQKKLTVAGIPLEKTEIVSCVRLDTSH